MLTVREQLRHALVESPKAILRLPARAWVYACFYMLACALICVLLTAAMAANDGHLGETTMSWLFPESWHFALSHMGAFFFESQSLQVLVNMAVAGSVILVSITLFPLKEHLSYTYEKEARLTDEEVDPLPLHVEAWEETKLLLLYATLFMMVFWVGYHPDPWRKHLAVFLSTTFVALTFAIDFLSPTLFRHRMRYATVFKALATHPVGTLAFGFLFAMPPLLAGILMKYFSPDNWVLILGVLFAAEVFAIVWACVGGTWMAAKMWPAVKDMKAPWLGFRLLYWIVLLGVFAWNVLAFGALGKSIYHKSPIFKSHYRLVDDSLEIQGLGLGEVLMGEPQVGFSVDVEVENPTGADLILEENRVEIRHEEDLVATTRLEPFRVPAGEQIVQTIGVDLDLDLRVALKAGSLLDEEKWTVTLFVELGENLDFPIYLR